MNYDIFDKLCRERNTTPTALVLKMGLSKGNTTSWKNGGNPSADILIRLADELNCTSDLLLGIKGKDTTKNSPDIKSDERDLLTYYNDLSDKEQGMVLGQAKTLSDLHKQADNDSKRRKIKMIKADLYDEPVSAGTGEWLDDSRKRSVQVVQTADVLKSDFLLWISGDSMLPKFNDKDVIMVQKTDAIEIGEIGIFVINGSGYVKRFGGDRLISINPDYDDILFEEFDEIYCQGKVLGVLDGNLILDDL